MIDRSKLLAADGRAFDPDRYGVTLRPLSADEGGGWLAEIPDLPGCTGDGETEMDALADVRAAALEWADAAMSQGERIPAPSAGRAVAAE